MGALSWEPSAPWIFDFYADYERLAGDTDRTTLQGFAGFENDRLRVGFQYSNQDRQKDPPLELVSGFIVSKLGDHTSVIARIDRLLQPSPKGNDITYLPFDPTARATLVLIGLELRPLSYLRLTPNVMNVSYDRSQDDLRPPSDRYIRLTFFLDFD